MRMEVLHIVRNSFWINKKRASNNEGKFHTYLKCRIWICNKEFNFSFDIRVSTNLAFFEKIRLFLALFENFCTGNTGYKTEPQFIVTSVASTSVLKNSPIFSKNAKFTLTLMFKEILNFLIQKFAFIVTCSVFLDSELITDNVLQL